MSDGFRLRSLSVRSRIVGLLTVLALVSLFGAGGVAYAVERARVLEQIDANLDVALESAGFTVGQAEWTTDEDALTAIVQRLAPDDNTGTLGILAGRAALTPGVQIDVRLEQLPGFVERVVAETAGGDVVRGTFATEGSAIRYLAAPVVVGDAPLGQPHAVFVTGYDVRAELSEINDAAQVYVVTALLATVATTVVGLLVSGRLLGPIRRIREVAERASAENLDDRVPVHAADDVSQLAGTVNTMLDRLGGTLATQRQLLQDVGHELNTPMTIMRGHLELVDPADAAEVAEVRTLVLDELDRMAALVDDIRAAAQLRDPEAFALREVDAGALVEQIAQKASAIEGAAIDPEVAAVPVLAMLDPARITQAMLQLVANAVRHGKGPITIASRVRGDELELSVRDRGPGVPDAMKSAIFDRFHRGTAEGRGDGGSGLGLAIVRLIAERHGGTASVVDAGSGSEFLLTLPGAVRPAHTTTTEEAAWHRS